jgi:hypothetical protein
MFGLLDLLSSRAQWFVAISLVVPLALMLLLWRTRAYWLPSALCLVHAAAAYLYGLVFLLVPLLDKPESHQEGGWDWLVGPHGGLGILLMFLLAGIFWAWAKVMLVSGVVVALATSRLRVGRGLPTRFGTSWRLWRRARDTAQGDTAGNNVSER